MKPLPTFPLEGGCSCGQVRYRLDAPPACVYVCHCTDCQTLSASAFSINGPIRPEALTITRGALRTWDRTAESGNQIPTHVCPHCGVRIYTVGVGTPEGKIIGFEGWSMRVRLDEETLKAVADITRAEYFYAGNAVDLKKVYQALNAKLVMERKKTEVTALFAGFAALLAVISAALSLAWFHRIV